MSLNGRVLAGLMLALLLFPLFGIIPAHADAPDNRRFWDTWSRLDLPVTRGDASRTWLWGPAAFTGPIAEPYAESPGGERTVQYFDKSRMETTHPDSDPSSPWYVTNGLLVVELMTGRLQVGDDSFEQYAASGDAVAGDPYNELSPTYATMAEVSRAPALAEGTRLIWSLAPDGTITADPNTAAYGVTAAHRITVPQLDHTVASVFWDFMLASGPVYEEEQVRTDRLFPDPFYATGLPVTEAYWAEVEVGGTPRTVLLQCFERRCLTYTPDNPPGWQVEAGNVGQHYYRWRYPWPPLPEQAPGSLLLQREVSYSPSSYAIIHGDGSMERDIVPPSSLPLLSPDATRLTWWSTVGTRGDLFVANADGTALRNVTNTIDEHEIFPTWSPDGTRLAAEVDGQVVVVNADGSGTVKLASGRRPQWAPDGRQLLFTRDNAVWTVNTDGTNVHRVAEGWEPEWSPDGAWIAFITTADPYGRWSGLAVSRPDGSSPSMIGTCPDDYLWTPDGRYIIFHASGGYGITPCDGFTYIYDMDSGERDLFDLEVPGEIHVDFDFAFSPDGLKVAFVVWDNRLPEDQRRQIYVGTSDFLLTQPLTLAPINQANPVWSPDGRWVAFAGSHPDDWAAGIYAVNLERRAELRRVTFDLDPSMRPLAWGK